MDLPPQTAVGATPYLYEPRRKSECTEDGRATEVELPGPFEVHAIMNACQTLSTEFSMMLNFGFASV